MPSDSNYAAVTRHRRALNPKAARPPVLELVDAQWAADKLSDDEVDVGRHEADAGGFEEGELDADAIVVSPAGNSSSMANSGECGSALVNIRERFRRVKACFTHTQLLCVSTFYTSAAERRRREEGWNDLGLDQLDRNGTAAALAVAPTRRSGQPG